jgi:hypothetical protein
VAATHDVQEVSDSLESEATASVTHQIDVIDDEPLDANQPQDPSEATPRDIEIESSEPNDLTDTENESSADTGDSSVDYLSDSRASDDGFTSGPVLAATSTTTAVDTSTTTLAFDIAQMVSKISSWAAKNEVNTAENPYLNGLITAASRRDDLTMWASLDPMKHLPVVSTASSSKRLWERISSLFFVLRNVLVFVPVALTWLAISNAVDGFGDYTQSLDSGQEANFLQFWQQADPWWRIGHVAFLDFMLIAAIVTLTLLQSGFAARAEKLERKHASRIEHERAELGFAILNGLQGKRQASPESIAESLAEALNDLTQAARDVNEVAARLERASTGVESLAPQIQVLNVRVEELVATFNSGLVGSMDQFAQSVRSLDQTVAGGVSKLFEETVIGVQEINEQLARTGASIEFGTKQLRDDLDAIHSKLGTVARGGR